MTDRHEPSSRRQEAARPAGSAQEEADRALRETFRGLAGPSLSPHFNRQLLARLEAESRRGRRLRRRLRLLQLYWLAATLASAVIVVRLPWPGTPPAGAWVLCLSLVLGALLPLAVIVRAVRRDPIELIFTTFDRPG